MSLKIAFFDSKPYDEQSFNHVNQKFGYDIRYFKGHLNIENVVLSKGMDVVCIFVNAVADAAVINQLVDNGVKLIALRCAGFNNVDLNACEGKIKVVRVPAYSPYAVAEHTLALMLTLNRKTHKAYNRTREGNFALNGLMGFDMHGKTAGIIGTGKIAKILIATLRSMGMKVLAYDIYPDENFAKVQDINYVSLDQLYENSDIISLHCPLTKDTEYIINDESISKMRNGVMIINTGRGKLINTYALIKGLKSKKIGYAGLDVYEEESEYFFEDRSNFVMDDDILARLLSFNNVIVTSHQAFFTKEALENIAETTLQNIQDFNYNKHLINEVLAVKSTK
jgi:D-lactate dehydrogenase